MVKLNSENMSFLLEALDLSPEIRQILQTGGQVDDDTADALRDLCTDLYDKIGLDADDKPTTIGQHLNELIDKLYIG